MKISKGRKIIFALILAVSLLLLAVGVYGLVLRGGEQANRALADMRTHAVMRVSVGAVIDDIAREARIAARADAAEVKMTRAQTATYASEQEAIALNAAIERYAQFDAVDSAPITGAIASLYQAQQAYGRQDQQERAAYAAAAQAQAKAAELQVPDTQAELSAEGGEVSDVLITQEETIDYSAFVPSQQLKDLQAALDPLYDGLYLSLTQALPDLPEEAKDKLKAPILATVYTQGDSFEREYDRYAQADAEQALQGSDRQAMTIARKATSALAIAIGLIISALTVLYYKQLTRKLGTPRLIILLFFILLLILGALYGLSVSSMLSDTLKRTGMYGILVLAMLPGIQSGISLNMGMPIGIIAGLMSTMIALEMNMTGWGAFAFAVVGGILLALPMGWLYGKLLNRLKGSEMTVATYVGFSFVSLMCIAWMVLPFRNPKLTWALGTGLRLMHNMKGSIGQLLDSLGSLRVFGILVPTGLLLFLLLSALGMWLFTRSKTGVALIAAGSNPRFAEASGIKVDQMRIIGTTLSTVIAAVGIIVYSQSFGFMQLYNGPRQMGFIAASAILIGGASTSRAKVSHVLIGTFLFQGVLAMGIQVANAMISVGGLSEVMRILISNGIILYALTQAGGEQRA